MGITGIAKSHQVGIQKTGKASSKLSDSLREQIIGCCAERLYGNKFLALRKSEAVKVAQDRAGIPGRSVRGGEGRYGIWSGNQRIAQAASSQAVSGSPKIRVR